MNEIVVRNASGAIPKTGIQSYDFAINAYNRTHDVASDAAVLSYLRSLKDRGYAPASINHKIKAFKKALLLTAERSGCDSTVLKFKIYELFKSANLKTIKTDNAVTAESVLTRQELDSVIAVTEQYDPRVALIIKALYQTAARISELIHVRICDCSKTKNGNYRIDIRHGKGNRQRHVFIRSDLFIEIRNAFSSSTYLFEFRAGRPMDRTYVYRLIKKAGRCAGIENLHPHTLRHTWATLNLKRLGLHKVSKYCGHADVSTTSRFYLHCNPTEEEIIEP